MIQAAGGKHWKAVGLNKRKKAGEQFAVDPGKRGAGSGFLRRRGEGARNHDLVEVLRGPMERQLNPNRWQGLDFSSFKKQLYILYWSIAD